MTHSNDNQNSEVSGSKELQSLMDDLMVGALNEEGVARLNELLTNNEELQRIACRELFSESLLQEELQVSAVESLFHETRSSGVPGAIEAAFDDDATFPAQRSQQKERWYSPFRIFRSVHLNNWITIAASIAIGVLSTIGAQSWLSESGTFLGDSGPTRVTEVSAAPKLVSMTACVWEPSGTGQPFLGHLLQSGEVLNLLEGIAEVEFGNSGIDSARVRIEGPASVYLRADGQLGLRFGSLTAEVNALSESFAFDTPMGRVVVPEKASLGIVAHGDRNEVHVFSGQAAINSEQVVSDTPIAVVTEGRGVSLRRTPNGVVAIDTMEASHKPFASANSMAYDTLNIGEKYRDAVLASNPAIYWRFEEGETEVANEGSTKGMKLYVDGVMSWRYSAGNRSAEFGLTKSTGSFTSRGYWPSQPLESYTVEMWVKPSHYHNGALMSLRGERNPDYTCTSSFLLEFGGQFYAGSPQTPANGVRYLHRSPPGNDPLTGTSCIAESYRVRRWQHLVARKNESRMELLVDGKLVSTSHDNSALPGGTRIVMGQLYPSSPLDTAKRAVLLQRHFVGQIDEVALYERALSNEEIASHYNIGRATPSRSELEKADDTST